MPNCIIIHILTIEMCEDWPLLQFNQLALATNLMKQFQRHSSVTVSSSHPPSSEGGSITDHGTWPWISGIRGALLPYQWWYGQCLSVTKGTLVCHNHFGATYQQPSCCWVNLCPIVMSVWGVLATQIFGRIPPWRPAQRCQSRLSGTSLCSRPTLNIAFKAYLSWYDTQTADQKCFCWTTFWSLITLLQTLL